MTIRLNTLNFLIWESQVYNLIDSQGCLGFIYGSISPPLPTLVVSSANFTEQVIKNPEFSDWMRTDKLIKARSLVPSLKRYFAKSLV